MAETTELVSKNESRVGGLSLICLLLAVLGFVSILLPRGRANRTGTGADLGVISVAVRMVSLLVAVVLGIFGRRSRAGRVGLVGSGALLAILLLLTVFLVSRHAASVVQPAPSAHLPH
jgi:hypothetical protein